MHPSEQARLEAAFGYSGADILRNRAGKLSDAQAAKIRTERYQLFYYVIGALALIGILTLFSFRPNGDEMIAILIGLGIPAGVAYWLMIRPVEQVLRAGEVQRRRGQVYLSVPGMGYMTFNPPAPEDKLAQALQAYGWANRPGMYMLLIDDVLCRLTLQQHEALVPGLYTVYYVPKLNQIVAVEAE
jgi:hypothetical protein